MGHTLKEKMFVAPERELEKKQPNTVHIIATCWHLPSFKEATEANEGSTSGARVSSQSREGQQHLRNMNGVGEKAPSYTECIHT